MRITDVKGLPLEWGCDTISDALSSSTMRKAVLVRVSTDAGITGTGEAFLYGCSPRGAIIILEEQLRGHLIGEDPMDTETLYERLLWGTMAFGRRGVLLGLISGIDIALWDIKGKAEGKPVSRLLNPGFHLDRIPSYASGGFYAEGKGLPELRAEAERYRELGYGFMKMKVGRNPERADSPLRFFPPRMHTATVEEDLRRIDTVVDVFGEGRVMIDANATYGLGTVRELAPFFESRGLYWIEEPMRFEDIDGLRETAGLMPSVPIAGFETEQDYAQFERLLSSGALEVPQVDIGWAGGFTGCMRIARLAASYGKKLSLHSFGSAVHFEASLQLAAALENTEMIESEENYNLLRRSLTIEPFGTDDEMSFYVPEKPGLGMTLDWDRLSPFIAR